MSAENEEAAFLAAAYDGGDIREPRRVSINDSVQFRQRYMEDNEEDNEDIAGQFLDREVETQRRKSFVMLKSPSTLVLLVLLFTFSLSQALVIAPNLDVMMQLICYHLQKKVSLSEGLDMAKCRASPQVTGMVAQFQSYRATTVGLLGLLVTPKLASLSDRWGRKPVLMLCCCSGLMADSITLLCIRHPTVFDYRTLLLASVFQGLGGSLLTVQVINAAYITDCVHPSLRVRNLGFLDSCIFGAMAAGPILGSVIQRYTHSIPLLYFVSVTLYAVDFFILLFLLVESRSLKARRNSQAIYDDSVKSWRARRASVWSREGVIELFRPLKLLAFSEISNKKRQRNARLMVVLASVSGELVVAVGSLLLIYCEFRFDYTSVETGYILSIFGTARMLVLACLFPIVVGYLRRRWTALNNFDIIDGLLIRSGLMIATIAFLLIGHAPNGKLFVGAMLFDSLAGIQIPAVKNAIIKHGHKDRIGELLGALSILTSLGIIVVPLLFLQIFRLTVNTRPQLVFEIVAGAFALLFLLSFKLEVFRQDDEEAEREADPVGPQTYTEEDPLLA